MSKTITDTGKSEKERAKALKKMERKVARAEERLVDYERLVDRTQHLLNTRIAEVEAARAELAQSEQRFRQLADAAFETILIHDGDRVLDANEAATELYRYTRDELLALPIRDLIHSSLHEQAWLHESTEEPVEVTHLRSDGASIPVEVRSRALVLKGRPVLVTAVRDITSHKEMQEKLRKIANSDPLTGVGNRRFFLDEAGKREYYRAVRYNQPLSLLMLDVDHFKRINDSYGHATGDSALKVLTRICQESLRASDVFARLGGEEFAAVLPGSDLEGAKVLAERVRAAVEASQTDTPRGIISFTLSIGISCMQPDDDSIETMLNRADKALYEAKASGRNRVVTAS